ncbi:hypothetical protein GJA_3737 [Janthinobacterium agaricidamnosum NBRC 102515 = DSM 9628]|uniref:Right handed beta helix domain-containing protein n=2 Tax=Janthinobacterium agaricidamnosum TaxID=55508 RepID=W0VAP4_9BURK|nr:hypothetical protein GJA_3737 [Janthinobacterium agaricidamnosum NBRC 102515 = DSM 9628]
MSKNIEEMKEEYSMLQNVKLRREKIGSEALIIKNANFKNGMSGIVCENTKFIGCYFYPDVSIEIISMNDVTFDGCQFMSCNFGGGVWNNVTFNKSDGRAKFFLLGGMGSKNVVFNECDFMGVPENEKIIHENYFGMVGTHGHAAFFNCNLKYVGLEGDDGLSIKSSRLEKVYSNIQSGKCDLLLDDVVSKDYFDLTSSKFNKVEMRKTTFEDLRMVNVETNALMMGECTAKMIGHGLKSVDATIRDCTFHDEGDPGNPVERRYSGFSTYYGKIDHLSIDNVRFGGSNGSLFIGGSINIYHDPKSLKPSKPIFYAEYGKISIKKTSLKRASLAYVHAEEVNISECDISDANFDHSKFDILTLRQVALAGKIDFTNTIVKRVTQENVRRDSKLSLIKTGAIIDI